MHRNVYLSFLRGCDPLIALLAATRVHPSVLTCLSLLLYSWAAALFAAGRFWAAGMVLIAAGLASLMEGPVARVQNRVTLFGSFLDAIVQRYADLILFLGLLVYYARVNRFLLAVLAGAAMAGAVMVAYAQARAESLIASCRVGFWKRPARLVLMVLGALANRMPLALWILAIGPNITVIHRILYTWKQTEGPRRQKQVQPASDAVSVSDARLTRSTHSGA